MPTIAIGDIHGNAAALDELLEQIRPGLSERDVVVFLGDYIDRGPRSRDCVEMILRLRDEGPAAVVCLKGNHEDWMLRAAADPTHHSWLLGMNAIETIRSYSSRSP